MVVRNVMMQGGLLAALPTPALAQNRTSAGAAEAAVTGGAVGALVGGVTRAAVGTAVGFAGILVDAPLSGLA